MQTEAMSLFQQYRFFIQTRQRPCKQCARQASAPASRLLREGALRSAPLCSQGSLRFAPLRAPSLASAQPSLQPACTLILHARSLHRNLQNKKNNRNCKIILMDYIL